ncbi:hypothetical protein R0137_05215 [Congregibacter brevis]|uniref:Uncharacterized protein n=1 Tax=Congregibacter brevis TaxID=3081201 RepID=A0ABZ0IFM7_9GAMM|nr:hypothetical protein R0137_05215 [Congregibacter sp. IMCC45268]
MELSALQDQVKLKVGRNILLLQQIERQLKFIVAHSAISGDQSTLLPNLERKKTSVGKRTLGMVSRDFINGPLAQTSPDEFSGFHISYKFEYELSEQAIDQLESLIVERNKLVHHFLEEVDFDSTISLEEAADSLDASKETILNVSENLSQYVHALIESRKTSYEALAEHVKNL